MKSLVVFLRIIIVGILWGIVFTEGLRVIMLCNWKFDIFWPDHWRQAMALWKAGWVVRAPKEWAFVLLIITYIPMLLTGWWTLSLVAWEDIIWKIITFPYTLYCKLIKSPINTISTGNQYGVVKRKSYKQIRPAGINTLRVPISDYGDNSAASPVSSVPPAYSGYSASSLSSSSARVANKVKKTDVAATIDHALFKFDDDDDDDFDLDIDSFEKTDLKKKPKEEAKKPLPKFDFDDDDEDEDEDDFENAKRPAHRKEFDFDDDDEEDEDEKPREKNRRERKRGDEKEKRSSRQDKNESARADKKRENRRAEKDSGETSARVSHGPVYDALQQKNYGIISNVTIGSTVIDFVGVSENNICLCLVDKESGDWLADEEMFNGEEPLWFSENSHRVSPVCLLKNARKIIREKLEDEGFEQNLEAYVVIQMANIINADDMFETWDGMDINVTRINRGAPKEIRLFSKTLPEADGSMSKKEVDRIGRILKSLK